MVGMRFDQPSARRERPAPPILWGAVVLVLFALTFGALLVSRPWERFLIVEEPVADLRLAAELDLPQPLEPQAPLSYSESPDLLADVAASDRTDVLHERGIAHFIQRIRTGSDADDEVALRVPEDDGTWARLIDDPSAYRGKLVEVEGFLVAAHPHRFPLLLTGLEYPNPSGLDRFHRSYLYGSDGKYYLVATFDDPSELEHRDDVRVRAYFLQLYTNEIEHQGQIMLGTVPFLVGRSFEPRRRPAATAPIDLWTALGIGVPLIAFAVFVGLWLGRDHRRAQRRRVRKQRGKEVTSYQGTADAAGAPRTPLAPARRNVEKDHSDRREES